MALRRSLMTTVYAVAEKAADIIRSDWHYGHEKGHKRGVSEDGTNGEDPAKKSSDSPNALVYVCLGN